jgi:hypothetical protein
MHVPSLVKAVLPTGSHVRRIPFGTARGLDFAVDFDRHLRFFLGLYETELTPWLKRFAKAGVVAYDVGADVGYQALVLARLSQSSVVAFEPRPAAAGQIERHYELNRDRIGPVHVIREQVGDGTSNAISLDRFAEHSPLGVPGLVLIDVDGGELDVLHGSAQLLGKRKPHIVLETHSIALENDCLAVLRDAGYEPIVINNRRLFGDYRPLELNRWIVAAGR